MKRTPLRRRSKATEKWERLERKELALRLQTIKDCQRCNAPCGKLDPHHYSGSRRNANRLRFVIIGRVCHDWIHAHANLARVFGWLAHVNGSLSPNHTIAIAEKRYTELMEQLTKKGGD